MISAWGVEHGDEISKAKKKKTPRWYENKSPGERPGVFNTRGENVRSRAAWGAAGAGAVGTAAGAARGWRGAVAGGLAGTAAGAAGGGAFGALQRDRKHKYAGVDRKYHNQLGEHRKRRARDYEGAEVLGTFFGTGARDAGRYMADARYAQTERPFRQERIAGRQKVRRRLAASKNKSKK